MRKKKLPEYQTIHIIKSIFKNIFSWAITLCRVVLGLLVIKTGFDFSRGSGAFAFMEVDDGITGIFVMLIGLYFVFSSLFGAVGDSSK